MTEAQPNIAADRLRALIARLPDASHVMCAVADLNEVLQELDEVTDFDRSALKTLELRDERERAVRGWHKEKKRAERAEAEADRLRDAWQQAWAERNEARSALGAIRRLVAKWAGPTTAGERLLAGEILTLTGGPWAEPDDEEQSSDV